MQAAPPNKSARRTIALGRRAPLVVLFLLVLSGASFANVRISVDSASLDFGTLALFQTRDRTIHVSNTSSADVEIDNITVGGANVGDFSVISPPAASFPIVVPAATTNGVSVIIRFTAMAMGTRTAVLTFETSDGPLSVQMTGDGAGANIALSLSMSSIDFGKIAPAVLKDTLLMLYSTGTAAATITGMQVANTSGDIYFSAALQDGSLNFPIDLAAGDSLGIVVSFDGQLPEEKKFGSLTVLGNIGSMPSCALTGEVAWGSSKFMFSNIDFGTMYVGEIHDTELPYKNTSDVDVSIDDIQLPTSEFSLQPDPGVPVMLPAGSTYTFHVRANPTKVGAAVGHLETISKGSVPAFQNVLLTANVLPMPLKLGPPDTLFVSCSASAPVGFSRQVQNSGSLDFSLTAAMVEDSGVDVTLPAMPVVIAANGEASLDFSVLPHSVPSRGYFVIAYYSGDNIVLQDTVYAVVSTDQEAATLTRSNVSDWTSSYRVSSSTSLGQTPVTTLVVRLASTDPNAITINDASIALVPELASASIAVQQTSDGDIVTITSADPIVLPADGSVLSFTTSEFITARDSASVSATIETPEWNGCIDFASSTITTMADSGCGSGTLREYLTTNGLRLTAISAQRSGDEALTLRSALATQATITVSNVEGSVVLQRSARLPSGDDRVILETRSLPAGAYFLRVVTSEGRVVTARFVR